MCLDVERGRVTFRNMAGGRKREERRSDMPMRQAVVSLVKRGLATEAEAARLAGLPRMTVYRWCQAAGVDWQRQRAEALARLWSLTLTRRPRK